MIKNLAGAAIIAFTTDAMSTIMAKRTKESD
jgi:hypothetical protein